MVNRETGKSGKHAEAEACDSLALFYHISAPLSPKRIPTNYST